MNVPKTFPDAPAKEHPTAGNSPDPSKASLADLLFDGASKEDVAEHLRSVRDEWSAHLIGEWLVLAAQSLPVLRRAEIDGKDQFRQKLEVDGLLSQFRRRGPDHSTAESLKAHREAVRELQRESRDYAELSGGHNTATAALRAIRMTCPALSADPRGKPSDKPVSLERIRQLRERLCNFFVDHQLEVEPDAGGWPRSTHRRDNEPRRSVRLVTVQQPGLRGTK